MRALPAPVAPPLSARLLGAAEGWRLREVVCRQGPDDRPFEEQHEQVSIAGVLAGSFVYRSPAGRALLYPGAWLLGNPGACFECGHEHGVGDRCLALNISTALFEEIAAGVTGSARFRFAAGMLPALHELAAPLVRVQAAAASGDALALEEAALGMVEAVLQSARREPVDRGALAARDARRVSAVLRHVEAHAGEALDLERLAAMACMSKYHFLRCFRRVAGLTPHQFVLGVRMRRAAVALRTTDRPIATIAFEAGFGDLSGFNHHFRAAFGLSPGAFRRGA